MAGAAAQRAAKSALRAWRGLAVARTQPRPALTARGFSNAVPQMRDEAPGRASGGSEPLAPSKDSLVRQAATAPPCGFALQRMR
jgi:hypothetical protein